jgi:hypothetical protein
MTNKNKETLWGLNVTQRTSSSWKEESSLFLFSLISHLYCLVVLPCSLVCTRWPCRGPLGAQQCLSLARGVCTLTILCCRQNENYITHSWSSLERYQRSELESTIGGALNIKEKSKLVFPVVVFALRSLCSLSSFFAYVFFASLPLCLLRLLCICLYDNPSRPPAIGFLRVGVKTVHKRPNCFQRIKLIGLEWREGLSEDC